MPSNTVLISEPVVGQLTFLSGPTPVCSCLQCSQLSERVHFLSWECSMTFYIFHRNRVCLVNCVDLICSLYSWWESFGSSSLTTLPQGFNCDFISIYACGSSTGVCPWGCPGGLGFAPVRARCGGGAAAWVAGFLAAPATQRSWWLGQQEIKYSRRVWQQAMANTLPYSCLENPTPWQRSLAGHSLQGRQESDTTKATLCT